MSLRRRWPGHVKAKKSHRETARPKRKPQEPARQETGKRVRKIVERHRETFAELAK